MHMQVNVYHTESAEIHYISHSLQGDMLYITQCAGRYAIYHTVSREICYIHCTCISHSLEIWYLSHSLREICYISHSVQGDMLYITQCAGRYAIYHTVCREICYISHSVQGDMLYITQCAGRYAIEINNRQTCSC